MQGFTKNEWYRMINSSGTPLFGQNEWELNKASPQPSFNHRNILHLHE